MKLNELIQGITRRGAAGLTDQALVSGSTFLTIAICAHSLPLIEQGRLGYVVSIYLAVLLINLAFLFQGASVRAPHENDKDGYRSMLLVTQHGLSVVLVAVIGVLLLMYGPHIGWEPGFREIAYFLLFLVVQQHADFERRAAYIFGDAREALNVSLRVYPLRIAALAAFQPETIEQALLILLLSAVPGIIGAYRKTKRPRPFGKHEISGLSRHLKFSGWLIATAPLGILWSYIPVFVLGWIEGPGSVAILVSMRSLANVANVLMEVVETQSPIYIARTAVNQGKAAAGQVAVRVLKIGGTLWVAGLLAIAMVGQQAVSAIFGSLYVQHVPLLMLLWFSYGVYFVTRVYGLKHRAFHNLRVEFWGGIAAVIVAGAASWPLIKSYGIYGAGVSFIMITLAMGIGQIFVIGRMERGAR